MRLVYLLVLLSLATNLLAQKNQKPENWLGINNLFFKHKDVITERLLNPGDSSTFLYNELIDHQFSLGLSFRNVKEDGSRYQQFDLAIDKNTKRSSSIISIPALSILEPQAGLAEEDFNLLAGYQRGRLLPIIGGLSGDIGVRGYLNYSKNEQTPFTSAAFPIRTTAIGSGFNLRTGLVYRIHKRLNIGYHLSILSVKYSWDENYVENPILTESQRINNSHNFDVVAFESALSLRNFHISYIF